MVGVKENVFLHIEDRQDWRSTVKYIIGDSKRIQEAYGGNLAYVESTVLHELSSKELDTELERILTAAGDGPAHISVGTGQIARGIIATYLPGAIVSDSGFPLNGEKTVQWLISHGFGDYPLIGLSGTPVSKLKNNVVRDFFATGNARYFEKSNIQEEEVITQVLFNRRWNIENRQLYESR